MMTPRFSLFFAGYSAYAPVQYYSKLSLVSSFEEDENEKVRERISQLKKALEDDRDEFASYLTSAIAVARDFELTVLPSPASHLEYNDWLKYYTEMIEKQFPMSRIEHYYFLYARKLGEITSNTALLKCYLDLAIELGSAIDLKAKMDKCLKDTEYILFKLVAAAALLSSEPRHNFFNVFYKELSTGFQPFKYLDVKALEMQEMKNLQVQALAYNQTVINGFKKGIGILKDLQS